MNVITLIAIHVANAYCDSMYSVQCAHLHGLACLRMQLAMINITSISKLDELQCTVHLNDDLKQQVYISVTVEL